MKDPGTGRIRSMLEQRFGLSGADADSLQDNMSETLLAGGDWLFRQGEEADALYLLTRGRLQVWIEHGADGGETDSRLLGEVAPGDCVGEIGLLTGGARTAGIRAIRDSQLLKLDKQAFEHFAALHPGLGLRLAGSIALTLSKRTGTGADRARPLRTVAILPLHGSKLEDGLIDELSAALERRGDALCLRSNALESLGAPVAAEALRNGIDTPLARWLDEQESRHRLLLYVGEPGSTPWSRLCVRQADIVFLLADATADPQPAEWERHLLAAEQSRTIRRALLLRHPPGSTKITGTSRWLDGRDLGFHLHLRRGTAGEIDRLLRFLLGEATGVVLGGGAARGFAELGVYRALHEAGVAVDWVGGTSIGGIIGAAIAQDRSPKAVIDDARRAFVEGKPFGDYTLPLLSLLRGRRMERLTQAQFEGDIEDLPLPFFCVSTRLDDGELHVHERGTIWRALRASAALPGMLTPAVVDRRLVVDGAVLNNLPVDIMQTKPVGTVIAVDVSSRRTFSVDYDELPSPWAILRDRLTPGRTKFRVPGVVSVLMKSAEIGTAARMRETAASADLLIRPPVDGFGLTDIGNFDRIVNAGYRHARTVIEEWLLARP